jgi:uncharacterized membrane protein
MRSSYELKQAAKAYVKPQLFEAIIAVFLIGLVLGTGFGFIIAGPLFIGLIYYLGQLKKGERAIFETLLDGFKEPLTSSIVGYILSKIFIFLWSLLFIIPGIIKTYSYAMTLFIISDNPTISGNEAITQSRKMMDGNKWNLFLLHLSFIGWFILGLFTFGLALIYIAPILKASELEFYHDIKNRIEII